MRYFVFCALGCYEHSCTSHFVHTFISPHIFLGVKYQVDIIFTLAGVAKLILSNVSFYTSTSNAWDFQMLRMPTLNTFSLHNFSYFNMFVQCISLYCCFFISLVTNDVGQILMCSLAYHLFFMKCFVKFKYFVHFKGFHFIFALMCRNYLFIQNMSSHICRHCTYFQYKVFFFFIMVSFLNSRRF